MPIINISGPQIDIDCKRRLAKEVTAVAAGAYGLPQSAIIVVIRENPPENVALGGELLADRHTEGN